MAIGIAVTRGNAGTREERPAIHVLVVDDSALVREMMRSILEREGMHVATAADPLFAMRKMEVQRPDVILLDLEMPRMDGLAFLRKIMSESPLPVVVCSALGGRGTETAMRALEEGAVAVVAKPRLGLRDFLIESSILLTEAIHGAARARIRAPRVAPRAIVAPRLTADAIFPAPCAPRPSDITERLVAIAASTGGTEALRTLLEPLPLDCPGLVIVQHMPEVYTAAFAQRLNQICRINVKEAAHGDLVARGHALIAPGNRHMLVVRSGGRYRVQLNDGPLVSRHRPSADVLFRTVATTAGANALGIIMTGMGDDGATGLLEMKHSGARTLCQDEASCVVFGMPKEAIARGAVDRVIPLARLAAEIQVWSATTTVAGV